MPAANMPRNTSSGDFIHLPEVPMESYKQSPSTLSTVFGVASVGLLTILGMGVRSMETPARAFRVDSNSEGFQARHAALAMITQAGSQTDD